MGLFLIRERLYAFGLYLLSSKTKHKQNKNNHLFTIGLEAVIAHLGIPTPDKARANPGRLIMEPIEAAIEDIEGKSKGEIMITPIYNNGDYANVHEFLKDTYRLLEERAENYMIEIAKRQANRLKATAKRREQAALKALEKKEQENAGQLKLPTE